MITIKQSLSGKKQPVNWGDVHHRLDAARLAIEHLRAPAAEDRKRILRERARLLAQEEEKIPDQNSISVVEFMLASEHYGIESSFVKEVLQIRDLTHLPGTPPFLLGIINIRGEICSVIDLKKFFSLPELGLPEFNKVIVIQNESMKFGIVVDSVVGSRQILHMSLKPLPPTFTGIHTDYVKGVAPGPVVILDGERILADRNLVVNEQV
ncbi:MAG: chemotaxis protein CheW [Methanoregula sp.]|nr:MAG: chemotaxis protein CheW [Methanoregula sp.]